MKEPCPADLEELWLESAPLELDALPTWLAAEEANLYRRVRRELSSGQERERLESLGVIVDETGVYLPDPTQEPVFSIGIYEGWSPLELKPVAANPVLTRNDVSDLAASYVSDPFLFRAGAGWHMFFEVWNWRANKGEIGFATSTDGLDWNYERIVLAEDFHLSYPYVFEWEGERWLVPESFQAGGVRLYRGTRFPHEWTFEHELIKGEGLVDASPFRHGGHWWMLVGCGEHDVLRLFVAEELHGPWAEHPASPVVVGDAGRARPAGRVVVEDERVIRFAQDCRSAYGSAVRAFEITELTASKYAERELEPSPLLAGSGEGWNAEGMHHIDLQRSGDGWLAAVDGWRLP